MREKGEERQEKRQPQSGEKKQPKIAGIVAEYNPFHNGHGYHLEQTRQKTGAEFVVVVMSGDFLQRGEPAIYSKWTRAEAAVQNGVDVVLELPFVFACNSAEYFSYGAVSILDRLGCVSHLVFGSECGDLDNLRRIAEVLACEPVGFQANIRKHLDKGCSYPKARYEALREEPDLSDTAKILKEPNNILAVEYVKQLILQKSSMIPVPVPRHKTGYKDLEFKDNMASATAIRQMIMQSRRDETARIPQDETGRLSKVQDVIPQQTYDVLTRDGGEPAFVSDMLFQLLQYKIVTTSPEEIAQIFAVGEGLEYRIAKSVLKAKNYEELVKAIGSKRYTQTRIQRALIHLLINFTKNDMDKIMNYTNKYLYGRVLGASAKGCSLLAKIKKDEQSRLPIYTNVNRQVDWNSCRTRLLRLDILAADIYNSMRGGDIYTESDYVKRPYIAKA